MLNSNNSTPKTNFFTVKEITTLALMTAACVVGRLAFQFIPNVQPMTAILLMVTIYRGLRPGLVVSLLSIMITNLYLGMGPWTISQLASYAVIITFAALLSKWSFFKRNLLLQIAFSILAGFIYGFVISVISFYMFGMTAFLPYYIQGLSFDFLHALGNGGFYLILGPVFKVLLDKYY